MESIEIKRVCILAIPASLECNIGVEMWCSVLMQFGCDNNVLKVVGKEFSEKGEQ